MPKTVLIVEDEYLIALDLKLTVEGHGWQVLGPATSVQEALQILMAELPSVALLDVNLGHELVTPVAEFLQARQVPFAVASAYPKPEQFTGEILSGVPNAGKPTGERRLIALLDELTAS